MRKPSSPKQEDNPKPNFLRCHKDEISGIGAIATAIAVILATIGLFLAYSQLDEATEENGVFVLMGKGIIHQVHAL